MLKNIIPNVFYADLQEGLEFFVEGLRFDVLYQDANMAMIARDGANACLFGNPERAAVDRTDLRIDTDDIDAIHDEIATRAAHLLHPGLSSVSLKPWGAREFVVLDKTTVCVTFHEWPKSYGDASRR